MMGHKLNVMMQTPYVEDKANLPVGLYVLHSYTEMKDRSQNVSVVVRNGTSRPIRMSGGRTIGRVVAANLVPDAEPSPEFLRKLNEDEPEQDTPKMTVAECQARLMEILEEKGGLDMLKSWPEKEATRARRLLMEYHNVFSLEKNGIGCTDATEHVIELTKSEPFKERF